MADRPRRTPAKQPQQEQPPAGFVPDNDTLSPADEAALDAAWARVKAEDAGTRTPAGKNTSKKR